MEWFGLVFTTLIMTILFSILMTGLNIRAVQSKWAEKRCDVGIMFSAFLYTPSDDPRSAFQFAADNFQFCLGKIADSVARNGMAPFFGILGQQSSNQGTVNVLINNLRKQLARVYGNISMILRERYIHFAAIYQQFLKLFAHMKFAVERINAIVVSIFYSGLSLSVFFQNFIDLVIKIIMIIIGIMIAMLVILWFALLPFIPAIIIPVLTVIVGLGVAAGGAAQSALGSFCMDPFQHVKLQDGTTKPLYELQIGDELASTTKESNVVTGVLYVNSTNIPLVSIKGVLMSGSHRVWDESSSTWVLAKDHPDAQPTTKTLPRLLCLNTTKHEIPLVNGLLASDWEEVSTKEGEQAWISFVASHLGSLSVPKVPSSVPLCGLQTHVFVKDKGWTPIRYVHIGDQVASDPSLAFTKVLGIYFGGAHIDSQGDHWMSDGTWVFNKETSSWMLPPKLSTRFPNRVGRTLVTESGTFVIQMEDDILHVRDFTEVGHESIFSCYEWIERHMKNPTSTIETEPCAKDS